MKADGIREKNGRKSAFFGMFLLFFIRYLQQLRQDSERGRDSKGPWV
jgi:hypothetical protein